MASELQPLDRFPEMLRRCREIRFEVNDDSGLFTVDERHAERARLLLEDVVALLGSIERQYALESRDEDQGVDLVRCSIADLSFLGRLELEGIAGRLAEAREKNRVWDVLRYADMGGARAEEALLALEASIREAQGLGARDHGDLDLGPALEVRRQYALLRYEMFRAGKPTGDELWEALEILLKRITDLREHATYVQVRVDDRLQIRSLQKRIREAVTTRDGENPERLWEDLDAAVDLLLHINRRPVLEDHDARLLAALGSRVESTRHLFSLLGRSRELDVILLEEEREADPTELQALLESLRDHFQN